jgi:hypothetical protein
MVVRVVSGTVRRVETVTYSYSVCHMRQGMFVAVVIIVDADEYEAARQSGAQRRFGGFDRASGQRCRAQPVKRGTACGLQLMNSLLSLMPVAVTHSMAAGEMLSTVTYGVEAVYGLR